MTMLAIPPAAPKKQTAPQPLPINNLAGLARFVASLGNKRNAVQKVWCVGDSETAGVGTGTTTEGSTWQTKSWPEVLRQNLSDMLGGAFIGGYYPAANVATPTTTPPNTGYLTVVTTGGSAPDRLVGLNGINFALKNGDTMAFVIPTGSTNADIVYFVNDTAAGGSQSGPFSWTATATGGTTQSGSVASPTVQGTPGPNTLTYAEVQISGLDATKSWTITITATSVTLAIRVCGVWWHGGNGIAIGRLGVPGYMIADSVGQGPTNQGGSGGNGLASRSIGAGADDAGYTRLLAGYRMSNAPLVVIMFGANEWLQQSNGNTCTSMVSGTATLLSTPCTPTYYYNQLLWICNFITNPTSVISYSTATQGCVLLVGEPHSNAKPGSAQSNYPGPETYSFEKYWTANDSIVAGNKYVASVRIADYWSAGLPTAYSTISFQGYIASTTLTVTSSALGAMALSSVLSTGASAGTSISSLGTGKGDLGTYNVNNSQTVGSAGSPATFTVSNKTAWQQACAMFQMSDGTHPNVYGHGNIGWIMTKLLMHATWPFS